MFYQTYTRENKAVLQEVRIDLSRRFFASLLPSMSLFPLFFFELEISHHKQKSTNLRTFVPDYDAFSHSTILLFQTLK